MPLVVRYALLGLVTVAVQYLVLGRLQLWGAYPDAVLLFVSWLGLRYGRRVGAISGFTFGILMDALYNTWGIQAFVKTLVGFLVGLFPANERETLLILPQQAFIGSFVIALLQNGLLLLFLVAQSGARGLSLLTTMWLGSALYTAVVGTIASLFKTH